MSSAAWARRRITIGGRATRKILSRAPGRRSVYIESLSFSLFLRIETPDNIMRAGYGQAICRGTNSSGERFIRRAKNETSLDYFLFVRASPDPAVYCRAITRAVPPSCRFWRGTRESNEGGRECVRVSLGPAAVPSFIRTLMRKPSEILLL